jgi:hypothetical protein
VNGSGFFFAFALVAFPLACAFLIEARRKVHTWLWLERQWEERKAMVAARRSGKRKKQEATQFLLFPETAQPRPTSEPIAVNDWSCSTPSGKAVAS